MATDSQYVKRFVLHIETTECIPGDAELTSLFLQVQDINRNRLCPLYITHIRSHTGLTGPLAIGRLLTGNVLKSSEFHKKSCQ